LGLLWLVSFHLQGKRHKLQLRPKHYGAFAGLFFWMSTRSSKRKRQASHQFCTSGVLYLRQAKPVAVEDGDAVKLGEVEWQARVIEGELVLTHVVSEDNKKELAQARRHDMRNEIGHRTAEAAALRAQISTSTDELAQVLD
jgi:hypothetical protein